MRSLLALTLVVLVVLDGVNAGGGPHPKQEQTSANQPQHPNQPHPPHHGTLHAAASGSGHQQKHQKHQNKVEKAIKEVMESKETNVKELKYENYDHFHAQFVEELKKKLEHMYGNHTQKKEIVEDVQHVQPNRFVNLYIEFLLYETVHEIVAKNEYNELLKIDHKKGEKAHESKKSGHSKGKMHEKEEEMHVGELIGEIAFEKYKKGMTDADFKKTIEQFHLFVSKLEKKSQKFAGEVKKIAAAYEKFKKHYPKGASTSAHQTGSAPSSPHFPATPKTPKRPVLRVETDRMDLDYHRRKFQEEIEARGLNIRYDTEFYRKHILEHASDTSHLPVPAHGHEDEGAASSHSPQQHGEGLDLNLPPLRLPSVRVSPRTLQAMERARTQQQHEGEGSDSISPPRMYAGLGSQLRFSPESLDASSPPRMYAGLGSQLRFSPESLDASSPPRMYAGLGSQLRFSPESLDASSPPRMYAGLGSQLRFSPESLERLRTAETIPFEEASPNTLRSLGLHHLITDDDNAEHSSASDAAEASSPFAFGQHQSASDFGDERQPSEVSRGSNDAVAGTPTSQRPTGEFSEDELRAVPRSEAEEASDFGGDFSDTERNIVPRGEAEEVLDLENAPKPDDESLSGGSDSVKGVEPQNLNDSFDVVADEEKVPVPSNKDDGEETEKPENDAVVGRETAEELKKSEGGIGDEDEDSVSKKAEKAEKTGE